MKKIMKKALSLMLVLVMVFALAPMTAKAAGTGTESDPIEVSANQTITSDGTGQSYYYVYNAPVAAEYEITVTGTTDSFGYSMIHPMTGMQMENYAYAGTLTMYATADTTTKEVVFSMFDYTTQELTISISMIEGTEIEDGDGDEATGATPDDAIALTESPAYVTLPGGGSMVYYKVAVDANASYTLNLYNRTGASFDLYTYNPMTGQYVYNNFSTNGIIDAIIMTDSTEYIFAIGNPGDLEVAVQVTLTKEGGGDEGGDEGGSGTTILGTTTAPDTLVMDEEMTTSLDGSATYWYKYDAAVDGKITVTPGTCTDGWTASVFKGADLSEYVGYYDSDNNTSFEVIVSADDVVLIGINNPEWTTGTVKFTATFTEGTFTAPEGGDEGDEGEQGGETETNYEMSATLIVVGDNALTASNIYTYTVHEFAPGEIGKYTFTTSDSKIGIVSTNGMWINVGNPGEAYNSDVVPSLVVVEDEIVWECTDVNQSIWIAVMADTNTANINVVKEELVIEEIPEIDYAEEYMEADPDKYTFDGEVEDLKPVIYVADTMSAAKDENGYYHLVPITDVDDEGNYIGTTPIEDCPLILVKLNDPTVSLANAIGYGDVVYVEYDTTVEPAKAEWILNFNSAINKYVAASDTDAKLYPLTDDLAAMLVLVGENQGWYEENGAVAAQFAKDGIDPENLVTFAMYYLEEPTNPVDPPVTGDTTNVGLWIAVLGLGVVAIAGSVVMRKREF